MDNDTQFKKDKGQQATLSAHAINNPVFSDLLIQLNKSNKRFIKKNKTTIKPQKYLSID